jgi:hypothetical protein
MEIAIEFYSFTLGIHKDVEFTSKKFLVNLRKIQ